jgi:YidC/Oxa1 family membrane protein insertase
MDNQRLLIWAFFGVMLFLTWQAWLEDYGPRPQADTATAQPAPAPGIAPDGALPDLSPAGEDAAALPELDNRTADNAAASAAEAESARTVSVRTDVLDLRISTRGATIQRAILRRYPVSKDTPDVLVETLSPEAGELGLLQTGLRISDRSEEPSHLATFTSAADAYELGDDDELAVAFRWSDGDGAEVIKTFRFRRGSYIVGIDQQLKNNTDTELVAGAYGQILRRSREPERSMFDVDSYSFDGPVIYDGERSRKLDRDDLIDAPYEFRTDRGWVATIQHHFLNAIVPPKGERQIYRVLVDGSVARASLIGAEAQRIAAGAEATFSTTAFIGPKLQAQMDRIDETLKLTVDYGWLTIISEPLFWLLSFVYEYVANWGLAIIIVTILIKLAFYKLTEASGRSMAKMREIQPRMKALQERYKDDRQALSQAMMDLYKREKVNPAAGCLPILIQMPFFLAFYWVLLESVEMRQAPFALWISDLSSRDPYFILPIIMGAAMLMQQKLNPAPADPVQARVMQIMPIMFTGFFAFFPAGLVLYWVTNTVLSIAQQWHINRVVEAEGKRRKSSKTRAKKKGGD